MQVIRIGTRASDLAMAQSGAVAGLLARASGLEVELVAISTEGDRSSESLATLGGTGVFVSGLREALLDGRCDMIVHSLKDLPTLPADGLLIAAIPRRADARDALSSREGFTMKDLPAGSRVGTGSPRRAAQLRSRRPDVDVIDIRGNVDTRLAKVHGDAPSLDAVVLAAAGLERLGRLDAVTEYLGIDGWPTAPGQGALAVETRADATGMIRKTAASVDHHPTRITVTAEREVLRLLEAGCMAPIGAHAILDDGMLFLSARVYRPDGGEYLTSAHALYLSDFAHAATAIAEKVSAELIARGAADLVPHGAIS